MGIVIKKIIAIIITNHSEAPGIPNNKTVANTFETIIVIDLKNKYNSIIY